MKWKVSGATLAFLSLGGCEEITTSSPREVKVFDFPLYNEDAEGECGGNAAAAPVRDCAKLNEPLRYTGLYLRTFEGSSFLNGSRPGVPFDGDTSDGYVDLSIDDRTSGKALLPRFRGPPVSVDTIYVEFVGRKVADRSSNPAAFGSQPIVVVDRILRASRVPDGQIKRRLGDGSLKTGF